MLNSEKDLEDYICNNQKDFIEIIQKIYHNENIKFLGRQVKIGNDNIADLVYYYNEKLPTKPIIYSKNYIIVELKYRQLEPKDLSQLSRYMTILRDKLLVETDEETNVFGLFVSFGCDESMQKILMQLSNSGYSNIDFLQIKSQLSFIEENYEWKDEYINNLILDDRLTKNIKNGDNK